AVARARWRTLDLPADRLDELLRTGRPLPSLTLPVRAPVSGTVVHAELTAGKVIDVSEHLAEVIDLSTVWVRVGVLEKDLHRVAVGQPVEVHLVAYPDDGPGEEPLPRPGDERGGGVGRTRQPARGRAAVPARYGRAGVRRRLRRE